MNVQHNCAGNHCDASGSELVWQEREEHGTRQAIHHKNPDDIFLNTAKMRDAIYVQQFSVPLQPFSLSYVLIKVAEAELASLQIASGVDHHTDPL